MHLSSQTRHHGYSLSRSNPRNRNFSEYSQSMVEEDKMKESVSTKRHTSHAKSTDNLYIAKL